MIGPNGCPLCVRYEGDVHYKRHDLADAARRLSRKPSAALAEEARARKADLAEVKRLYRDHRAAEHPDLVAASP